MKGNQKYSVAFLFFTDFSNWHGGKNYFLSLFSALESDPYSNIQVVAVVGKKNTKNFGFPKSVKILQTSALDRYSLPWFIDRIARRLIKTTIFLNWELNKFGIKVISHSNPFESNNIPTISWIPDFQHIHLPQYFDPKEIKRRNKAFKSYLNRASLVIVSSYSAKNDLEFYFPENSNKGRVLQFCAIESNLFQDLEDLKELYGLSDRYFYMPNQLWAHKNHLIAIEALAQISTIWPDVQIICTGLMSDHRNINHINKLKSRIDDLGLSNNFKLLGLIPYDHIPRLITNAQAVINPSFFEGWSTTVEESKALGAPLLLSDIEVHKEQCTNGEALFFSPRDSSSLVECMKNVLNGHWVVKDVNKIEKAQKKYKSKILKYSQNYQSLIQEIVKEK
jgi:glycosyltransferase involved in cell wall biosynthesis